MLRGPTTTGASITRIQNNIQSLFSRVRLLYGATPIEDIINYNQVVRMLTEWTGTSQVGSLDQTSVADGVGGVVFGVDGITNVDTSAPPAYFTKRQGFVNIRQAYIQGLDYSGNATTTSALTLTGSPVTAGTVSYQELVPNLFNGDGFELVPVRVNETGDQTDLGTWTRRRYQVSLALGVFNQEKLLPTKFMASQLAIEITLATEAECLFCIYDTTASGSPTYKLQNVNLIPEILEFDASYDAMFLKGLQEGGVPIKFSSWHTYIFGTAGSSNLNLQIQERSRSVKGLVAVQRRAPYSVSTDSGATFLCSHPAEPTDTTTPRAATTLQSYQFRIGGRYFPASPVQVSTKVGSSTSNGGAEAFVELQKVLNTVGDMRLSTGCNILKWGMMPAKTGVRIGGNAANGNTTGGIITYNHESDYVTCVSQYQPDGQPALVPVTRPNASIGNSFSGNMGSQCFAMAIDLETSNGMEISGLNAEEQSDISLIATYSGPQNPNYSIEVYAYYDAMIILRENNVRNMLTIGYRTNSIGLLIKFKHEKIFRSTVNCVFEILWSWNTQKFIWIRWTVFPTELQHRRTGPRSGSILLSRTLPR